MRTLRTPTITRDASYEDRYEALGTWFDADVDASASIPYIVERFAINLERILGVTATSKMFAQLPHMDEGWRVGVETTDFWLETELGAKLYTLSGYAVFGLLDPNLSFPGDIEQVEAMLIDCPPEQWLPPLESDALVPIITMARARWNLDNGLGLSPEGLALLGSVKLTRIRNMMSGNQPEIPKDSSGLLSNDACRAWLDSREVFLPTLSYDLADELKAGQPKAASLEPVFVPVARDGSWFSPDLKRNGHYQIGEKGNELQFSEYDDALTALQKMQTARWRRPNDLGNWGIVSAVEWRRVERSTL